VLVGRHGLVVSQFSYQASPVILAVLRRGYAKGKCIASFD
jgi:hypothetical protein